ncbi:MAG: HD domain-containing protein [Ruminococcaceae bacterium]|nr:HD domain-containing protein [Oscillospiraceae bacterium]
MQIPDSVRFCLDRLENAGFAAFVVGGCVRDACLGLEPSDWDMCTAALPEQTESIFSDRRLVLAGKKHGTVGVVTDSGVVEITTFRTEGDYRDNRHPEWVKFVPDIEADLARRDFTVNAMAYSPTRGFADPFGGRSDLEAKILRTVGDPERRFREDALRILRGVRFSVRYGLMPEEKTLDAMISLRSLMDTLARERVFEELCKLIVQISADELRTFAPILAAAIPELEATIGFQQHNPHHIHDVFGHTACVVEAVPAELALRWAALLHDIAKPATFSLDESGRGHFYGHGKESAAMANAILLRLKAPTALRERVVLLIGQHMNPLIPDRKILRRRLSTFGSEAVWQLLALQEADWGGKGTDEPRENGDFREIRQILQQIEAENACLSLKNLAVSGHDLMALGFAGPAIGKILNHLLSLVLEEQLPNEKNALLEAAKEVQP